MSTLTLFGCSSHPPMPTVDYVNINRFMGDWYVIANIPTFIETDAHNAVETYNLNDDGTVATTFTFNEGDFSGEKKIYRPKGFILDKTTNATWGMQFIWPIKADYRVIYLDEDYNQTIIGRKQRDYVWIMARSPEIPDKDYQHLVQVITELGYDTSKLQKVPQQWPGQTGENQ
ncbi:MAG: lipocalin family protein [Desulfobacter sp.]|jgi:apolipoprotein D and lipocalin family protein|nr:lipocalin family protein [Desulfobacter sp.]